MIVLLHVPTQVGTPDSSRIWDGPTYRNEGKVVENSKEMFRMLLQKHVPDPDVLLNKVRFRCHTVVVHGGWVGR